MMYSPAAAYEEGYVQYQIPSRPTKITTTFVKQLIAIKDAMEKEIRDLMLSLDKVGVGLKTPLVDDEGFPRADLDLNDIRSKRHRIACLQNDHISLMNDIQNFLYELHEESRANAQPSTTSPNIAQSSSSMDTSNDEEEQLEPFLKVNTVSPNSPAEKAGLHPGDEITQFGYLVKKDIKNNGLKILPTVVQSNVNKPMKVHLLREEGSTKVKKEIILVPSYWSGQGLLGCHFLEIH
ncbi:hypothetical protein FDP41_012761 [Naegleria fowleri]|uniref:Nas2 N-terminal domain-containing protein n=1 Tax=Naegleria fowleri TaxID=5763 RepID=A0A6A5BZJ3_NAEFO|nr:uncharacterized protein FDP41_013319 [Naegleria fowleri]XP_044565686.1 uncharacterized protein FDP41_012761 [Naegleria fowleri]KAF0980836.1 hypothetical protein FDP41_013319 [Naegleria fowleri]KAF0980973.1 hypothetical protein FDP41_012761 [Naegleria fowleri]